MQRLSSPFSVLTMLRRYTAARKAELRAAAAASDKFVNNDKTTAEDANNRGRTTSEPAA